MASHDDEMEDDEMQQEPCEPFEIRPMYPRSWSTWCIRCESRPSVWRGSFFGPLRWVKLCGECVKKTITNGRIPEEQSRDLIVECLTQTQEYCRKICRNLSAVSVMSLKRHIIHQAMRNAETKDCVRSKRMWNIRAGLVMVSFFGDVSNIHAGTLLWKLCSAFPSIGISVFAAHAQENDFGFCTPRDEERRSITQVVEEVQHFFTRCSIKLQFCHETSGYPFWTNLGPFFTEIAWQHVNTMDVPNQIILIVSCQQAPYVSRLVHRKSFDFVTIEGSPCKPPQSCWRHYTLTSCPVCQ